MYEYINGTIAELTPAYAVAEAGGVGYFINISLQTYSELEGKPSALVYVHYIVREDAQILYGFATKQERELFRMLIGVSGVGGGTARMILSTYAPKELSNIIATENAGLLKNVKGLGLKTAQKIIVELKDKIMGAFYASAGDSAVAATAAVGENYDEALAALTMLGFPKSASEKILRTVIKDNPTASVEDIIRLALKRM
jgi:Holliday junction DNA helicase RuvA